MSPVRREPDGTRAAGASWLSLIERRILEAQERGSFDALPQHGRRLSLADDRHAGEMATAFSILRGAGLAPPWIEADKEVRRLLEARQEAFARHERMGRAPWPGERRRYAELVAGINRAVDALNALTPSSRLHRRRLDPAAEELAFARADQPE